MAYTTSCKRSYRRAVYGVSVDSGVRGVLAFLPYKVILKTAHSFRFRINDAGRQVGVRVSIDTVRKEWMQVMCTLDCLSY